MENNSQYLKIKEYYESFINAHFREVIYQIKDYRFFPKGGYSPFYRGEEIVNILHNIEGNISEKFANLSIPDVFASFESLKRAIISFYEYLKSTEEIFQDVFSKLNLDRNDIEKLYPTILTGVYETKNKFQDLFEHLIFLFNTEINEIKENVEDVTSYIKTENKLYDIIILTAIYEEYKAVKDILDNGKDLIINDNSRTIYYESTLMLNNDKTVNLILCCANQMGLTSTANLTTKLIYRYNPKVVAMCGIAAGIKGKIGDVMIPDILWDYGSGKNELIENENSYKEQFSQYRFPIKINQNLIGEIIRITKESSINIDVYDSLNNTVTFKDKAESIEAHIGPFVSGSAVIANDIEIKKIKEQDGKLIGLDMEAYAIAYCSHFADIQPQPISFIIKSISDFGNKNKAHRDKDKHQKYAASTSAKYLIELLIRYPDLFNL